MYCPLEVAAANGPLLQISLLHAVACGVFATASAIAIFMHDIWPMLESLLLIAKKCRARAAATMMSSSSVPYGA